MLIWQLVVSDVKIVLTSYKNYHRDLHVYCFIVNQRVCLVWIQHWSLLGLGPALYGNIHLTQFTLGFETLTWQFLAQYPNRCIIGTSCCVSLKRGRCNITNVMKHHTWMSLFKKRQLFYFVHAFILQLRDGDVLLLDNVPLLDGVYNWAFYRPCSRCVWSVSTLTRVPLAEWYIKSVKSQRIPVRSPPTTRWSLSLKWLLSSEEMSCVGLGIINRQLKIGYSAGRGVACP